jgi:hypothetical protein
MTRSPDGAAGVSESGACAPDWRPPAAEWWRCRQRADVRPLWLADRDRLLPSGPAAGLTQHRTRQPSSSQVTARAGAAGGYRGRMPPCPAGRQLGLFDKPVGDFTLDEFAETVRALERDRPSRTADELPGVEVTLSPARTLKGPDESASFVFKRQFILGILSGSVRPSAHSPPTGR